jgi:stage II sporulation protein AB (anti-sigma F factor)
MEIIFDADSINESFARTAVASFITGLDPTLEEMSDVRTAVSEAVTNAIIHGYDGENNGSVRLRCVTEGNVVHIEVEDKGVGIEDVKQAMEPFYTTRPELERSGMGFAFMEAFMDEVEVVSAPDKGTKVTMTKRISHIARCEDDDDMTRVWSMLYSGEGI